MSKKYTIGVMIGNANSPHTMDLMQGIFHAAESMSVNVLFFLGIHSSYYYKSYFGEDAEDDYDYQFNAAYDYEAFADLDALIMEVTKGEGVNVVFEAAGIPALLEHAVKILSPAGRLVAMTFGQTPIAIDFKAVNAKELTILGTRHQMEKFPETLEQLPNRLDRVDRLITHVFPAEKYEEAFAVLADKGSGAGKVVLTFD